MSQATEHREFQAEVRQLLDIVIHSLYTDKEIFVRELVSNASDALDKLKHIQLTQPDIYQPELPLEIHITTNEEERTLSIADHGIGLTRAELVENLGTIAHSGSKAFVEALKQNNKDGGDNTQLIGQFGVGFYSAFMVASEVDVFTASYQKDAGSFVWTSDGKSGYTIDEAAELPRGARVVLHLNEADAEFAKPDRIKAILAKYSNFVGYPILLNGERVNTVEALWLKNKSDVTQEEYNAFYKFTAHTFEDPTYTLHVSLEGNRVIKSLLFSPGENMELWGMGQLQPGVALYCKKVLIDPHPPKLLPEWMRFIRGVIDCEDIPLNISRESMQDSALVRSIGDKVAKRFLKFLDQEANDNAEKYLEFYKKFSRFIKEGVATDHDHKEAVAKLLRFESSMTEPGQTTSLAEYITRAKEEQKSIYYQIAPSRTSIETGPYLEAFKARGLEVIYLHEQIDDYVINSLREFDGKTLRAVNADNLDLPEAPPAEGEALSEEATNGLITWLKEKLGEKITEARTSSRLVTSPAAALLPEHEPSAQMRHMMRAMRQDTGLDHPRVILEINPRSNLIKDLASKKESDSETATLIAEHMLDTTLLSAGLIEDPQQLAARSQKLLEVLASKLS
jgi:TNF receptor-associated protein 1